MHIAEDRCTSPEACLEGEARRPTKHGCVAGKVAPLTGVTQRHDAISGNLVFFCTRIGADARARCFQPRSSGAGRPVAGDQNATKAPILIVEGLSPSTDATDRRQKFAACRGLTSVQEYALVSRHRQPIETYRRRGDIGWVHVSHEPGDEVEFAAVGLRAPIAAFYEGTNVVA